MRSCQRTERSSESCLHREINDLIQEHVEGQETVDIAELAARMAESLVGLALLALEEQQAHTVVAKYEDNPSTKAQIARTNT
jgi:hypothetical protein